MLIYFMMRSFCKYLFLFGVITLLTFSCVKKKTYPTTPEIEYQDFYPYVGDSADIQIKFTDGDGDIGVSSSSNTENLFITYYYLDVVTNKYVGYYSPFINDTLRTGYVVRAPKDSYEGKPISGELSVRLQQSRHSTTIKHVKYVIYLLDNKGNKSMPITTPVINIP